jgi:hypothetical protein
MSSTLLEHLDHPIEIATYGRGGVVDNTALECLDCNEVIRDVDAAEGNPALEAMANIWGAHAGHRPTTDGSALRCCNRTLPFPT